MRPAWILCWTAAVALLASCANTAAPRAPRAADARALLALHERVLEAHRRSDPAMLLEGAAEEFVQAGRGQLTRPTLAERRERFTRYLGATRFTRYADDVPPVVEVSADGTLGWVVAQVSAEGLQSMAGAPPETLRFTSAWIELYRKVGREWTSVGNVSNFKP